MTRSSPAVRATQRARRKARRIAEGLCLYGLSCARLVIARPLGHVDGCQCRACAAGVHVYCYVHRASKFHKSAEST